jgi:xylulokinase
LLAGIGAGLYRDADDAFQNLSLDEETFIPDPASAKVYSRMYETFYRNLYSQLVPINHDIEAVLKLFP